MACSLRVFHPARSGIQSSSKFNVRHKSPISCNQHRSFTVHTKEQKIVPFLTRIFAKVQNTCLFNEKNIDVDITSQLMSNLDSDLRQVKDNLVQWVNADADHYLLKAVSQYYLDLKGKRVRPMAICLMSRAIDFHNKSVGSSLAGSTVVNSKQIQLASIVEMIHTASLMHDDVVDDADTRRGVPSINHKYDNKLSILSGDYLLGVASKRISYLESHEVTRLMSTAISNLVEGEFMQLKPAPQRNAEPTSIADLVSTTASKLPARNLSPFQYYIRKTYMKTASLIANGCRSAAILSDASPQIIDSATIYAENFGIAFQLIDDLLDITGTSDVLGKSAAVDLKLGLATAPVLFASEEYPELINLIEREFKYEGDVEKAQQLVLSSKGISKTRELAEAYCKTAENAILKLEPSAERSFLIELTHKVLDRKK